MDSDLRIRLEGKVEAFEAAVFAWEGAAKSLLAERWRAPGRWKALLSSEPSLDALDAALTAKAPDDLDVQALRRRLRDARESVRARGIDRLTELQVKLPPAPTLTTVLGALTQPPRVHFRSRPGTLGTVIEGAVASLSAGAMAVAHASIFTVVAVGGTLAAIAITRRVMSARVLLTDTHFKADRDGCSLDEISRVVWQPWKSELGHDGLEFDFELIERPGFTVYLSDGHVALRESLTRCGVKCEPRQ